MHQPPTKFEVHFQFQHYSAGWTWPLTFRPRTWCTLLRTRQVGNLPINVGVSRTFRSRLIAQHLSDASRDLATFDLGGHGACGWCGSSGSICVPSLKFVGLPVRKILGIYCVNINPNGDLDLWPFDLKISSRITRIMGFQSILPNLGFRPFRSRVMLRHGTDRQTDRRTDRQTDRPRGPFYNALFPTCGA